jgi:hypothetical protein
MWNKLTPSQKEISITKHGIQKWHGPAGSNLQPRKHWLRVNMHKFYSLFNLDDLIDYKVCHLEIGDKKENSNLTKKMVTMKILCCVKYDSHQGEIRLGFPPATPFINKPKLVII